MFRQSLKTGVGSLIVGTLLAATPISSMVFAQDAITLEMIGAVRMANPDEIGARSPSKADPSRIARTREHPEGRAR